MNEGKKYTDFQQQQKLFEIIYIITGQSMLLMIWRALFVLAYLRCDICSPRFYHEPMWKTGIDLALSAASGPTFRQL